MSPHARDIFIFFFVLAVIAVSPQWLLSLVPMIVFWLIFALILSSVVSYWLGP